MCWRRSKLYLTEPGATGLRGAANTQPRWKKTVGPFVDDRMARPEPKS
jgi:hypothetical protein